MKELKARNKEIRRNYKLGQGGVIGKQVGISRQRVHQIIHRKHRTPWKQFIEYIRGLRG